MEVCREVQIAAKFGKDCTRPALQTSQTQSCAASWWIEWRLCQAPLRSAKNQNRECRMLPNLLAVSALPTVPHSPFSHLCFDECCVFFSTYWLLSYCCCCYCLHGCLCSCKDWSTLLLPRHPAEKRLCNKFNTLLKMYFHRETVCVPCAASSLAAHYKSFSGFTPQNMKSTCFCTTQAVCELCSQSL